MLLHPLNDSRCRCVMIQVSLRIGNNNSRAPFRLLLATRTASTCLGGSIFLLAFGRLTGLRLRRESCLETFSRSPFLSSEVSRGWKSGGLLAAPCSTTAKEAGACGQCSTCLSPSSLGSDVPSPAVDGDAFTLAVFFEAGLHLAMHS